MKIKSITSLALLSLILASCGPSSEDISNDFYENYSKEISLIRNSGSSVEKARLIDGLDSLMQANIDSLLYQEEIDEQVVREVQDLVSGKLAESFSSEKELLYQTQKELINKLSGTSWYSSESKNIITFGSDGIEVLKSREPIAVVFNDSSQDISVDGHRLIIENDDDKLSLLFRGKVFSLTSAIEENYILGSFSGVIKYFGSKNYFTLKLNNPDGGVLYAKFANGQSENYPIRSIRKLSKGRYKFTDKNKQSTIYTFLNNVWKGEIGDGMKLTLIRNKSTNTTTFSDAIGLQSELSEQTSEIISSGDSDWDEIISEYEKLITAYINVLKKSQEGDVTALMDVPKILASTNKLQSKLQTAGDNLSTAQMKKFTSLQTKLAKAAAE